MSEHQYASYFKFPKQKMGTMASQLYRDDPKMLGIHLARYKFVAKLLAGKELVADVGCGDGWFSRVVRREVGELHLYDFDKRFVDEIKDNDLLSPSYCHDILKGRLEYGVYDAVYSLDCMEHIELDKQDIFLANICASMEKDGVCIIGMPSLESQAYASEASKAGHVGCRSGAELKLLLERHFQNVFIFSGHDEVVSTAFLPMSHYIYGVCCGVR